MKSRLNQQAKKIQEHNSNIQPIPEVSTKPDYSTANILKMILESINRNPKMLKQSYYTQGEIEDIPSLKEEMEKRGTLLYQPKSGI